MNFLPGLFDFSSPRWQTNPQSIPFRRIMAGANGVDVGCRAVLVQSAASMCILKRARKRVYALEGGKQVRLTTCWHSLCFIRTTSSFSSTKFEIVKRFLILYKQSGSLGINFPSILATSFSDLRFVSTYILLST